MAGKPSNPMGGQSHSDHHTLWINPRNGNHLIIGNDGGLDISYDQGTTWEEVSTMPTGQFYAISADMRKPYYVCGGLQDNGSWCGPSAVRSNAGILLTDWYRVGGGDGFYTQNDPYEWTIGYSESQDGTTNRYNLRTGETQSIRPRGPGARGDLAGGEQPAPTSQVQQAQQAQQPAQQPSPAARPSRSPNPKPAVAAAPARSATSSRRCRRRRALVSTGAPRSSSRLTIRARSTSAQNASFDRAPAAIPGRRRPT